ncbi:S-adenosyl-L-methionine-dependent methyltransferase [Coniochaeta sp. 2T2.1]|nr:S-adenosyl-L-methionine-dependent methyltransferase [Coniochaeta sp. 2T2.1]
MADLAPENYSLEMVKRYNSHFIHDPRTGYFVLDPSTLQVTAKDEKTLREQRAAKLAEEYYDFVSPMYEQGWGQRFHYTPMTPGLSIAESMSKYERDFAEIAGLKKGLKVLDLGCGVGGPARTLARHIGCEIVGVANNAWLVERGQALTKAEKLDHLIGFVEGDFMHLPFDNNTFDAAYSFEALCYSPDPAVAYKEAYRVLKPGGLFAFHDFAMTDKYNDRNPEHRKIKNWIEYGNGIMSMPHVQNMRDGLKEAGFGSTIFHEEDMSKRSAPAPWYFGPSGNFVWANNWADFWKVFVMSPFFLFIANRIYEILIFFGKKPKEVKMVMDTMWYCCRSVAIGGKRGVFTPLYMFAARKPGGKDRKGGNVRTAGTDGDV